MVALLLGALLLALFLRGQQFAAIGPPTITGLSGTVEPGAYTLSGTCSPGSIVEVTMDGQRLGRVPDCADGTWSLETSNMDPGFYGAVATAYDADNGIHGSASIDWKVAAPVVAAAVAVAAVEPEPEPAPVVCVAPTLVLPANATASAIMLGGAGTAGTNVEAFRNGSAIGSTTVDDSGNWSLLTRATSYNSDFEVFGCLDDGRLSSGVSSLTFAGAAMAVMLDEGDICSGFEVSDDGASSGMLALSGTGEAGMTVEVYAGGDLVGTVKVGDDSTWSYSGDMTGSAGAVDVSVRMISEDGSELSMAEGAVCDVPDLAVAEAEPEPEPEPEEESEAVVIESDAELVVSEFGNRSGMPTLGLTDFGMSGTGRPGSVVVVLEDGTRVGGARVLDDGTWSCTCILPPGEHILIVQDENDPDLVSEPITYVVENLTEAPEPPTGPAIAISCSGTPPMGDLVGTVYFVAQCESFSLIAQRLGTTTAKLLQYNPQLTDVRLIYPGQGLNVPLDAGCFDDNS